MTETTERPTFAADGITAPLRHSIFRRIWLASLLSNLGILIQGVGAAWAMTQMASSADKVALVQTALMLPVMLSAANVERCTCSLMTRSVVPDRKALWSVRGFL